MNYDATRRVINKFLLFFPSEFLLLFRPFFGRYQLGEVEKLAFKENTFILIDLFSMVPKKGFGNGLKMCVFFRPV